MSGAPLPDRSGRVSLPYVVQFSGKTENGRMSTVPPLTVYIVLLHPAAAGWLLGWPAAEQHCPLLDLGSGRDELGSGSVMPERLILRQLRANV